MEERLVNLLLLVRLEALQSRGDHFAHILHRMEDSLAAKPPGITVQQLDGFAAPRADPRRHGRFPIASIRQKNFGLNRGIAAEIQDLPRPYFFDFCRFTHFRLLFI